MGLDLAWKLSWYCSWP